MICRGNPARLALDGLSAWFGRRRGTSGRQPAAPTRLGVVAAGEPRLGSITRALGLNDGLDAGSRLSVSLGDAVSDGQVRALRCWLTKFDRADVIAAVPEHATERVVDVVDVAAAQAVLVGDDPSELERHFGHEAEGAAARGLGELDTVRLESRECVGGQVFGAELALDGRDEIVPDRAEVRPANTCSEDRELSSFLSVAKKLSATALSKQSPLLPSRSEAGGPLGRPGSRPVARGRYRSDAATA